MAEEADLPSSATDEADARALDRPWNRFVQRFFAPDVGDKDGHLWPRWLFLRALGVIFFSAFYSLAFQIHGLIGPHGVVPAGATLAGVTENWPLPFGFWAAPTLLWIDASDATLTALVAGGLLASVLLFLNLWPRVSAALATLLFLSFVSAASVFSHYQSDDMLLEAGVLAFFFAPRGLRPGLGERSPPSRASLFLLQWEWFRIYFESGVVKLLSGDPQWKNLTSMVHYYETGPLPTPLSWYAHQLPWQFHWAIALFTLVVELGICFMLFLPRRFRVACFLVVTPMQIGIILTANYAFLNDLVLSLGVLLLDDGTLSRVRLPRPKAAPPMAPSRRRTWGAAVALSWLFYATLAAWFTSAPSLFRLPHTLLEPLRIANAYGLFARMTPGRYEIEFEGTADGAIWVPYRFRYKPQALDEAPAFFAPYQPRFEWNLWFASLGPWERNTWVLDAEDRLLANEPSVLALFRENPFPEGPPMRVRATLYEYFFTDAETRRRTGNWWTRERIEAYGPMLERQPDGSVITVLTMD